MCVVNIVARSEKSFSKAMVDLRAVFDDIRICDPTDDDVNRLSSRGWGRRPDRDAWRARLRTWAAAGDPLGLEALLTGFDQAVFNVDTEALDACD